MFSFKPLSDQEIHDVQNRGLMPDGDYPFKVKSIESMHSEAGNPMLKVVLGVLYDGEERNIIDYLVTTEKMIFKLKHFCETIGLLAEYEKGIFRISDCFGRTGKVKITTQKGRAKDDGSFYPDKNTVKDYAKAEDLAMQAKKSADFQDDDIKF